MAAPNQTRAKPVAPKRVRRLTETAKAAASMPPHTVKSPNRTRPRPQLQLVIKKPLMQMGRRSAANGLTNDRIECRQATKGEDVGASGRRAYSHPKKSVSIHVVAKQNSKPSTLKSGMKHKINEVQNMIGVDRFVNLSRGFVKNPPRATEYGVFQSGMRRYRA